METTRSVPKNMQYILRSLGQFQTQRVQLSNTSANDVSSGGVVSVRLPTTGMLDLHSLAFYFKATATATNAPCANNNDGTVGCAIGFPRYTSSLIRRLEVLVGGAQADNINDYNRLFHALLAVHGGSQFQYNQSPAGWANLETPATKDQLSPANLPGVIDHFLGFLGGSPRIIDASLFPPIEIRLTLAEGTVLVNTSADSAGLRVPTNPTFTLKEMHWSIQSYRFSDDMIQSIFYNQLAQGLTLPYQWKTWTGTRQLIDGGTTHAIKSTMSNASASKILTVLSNSAFTDLNCANTSGAATRVGRMFYHESGDVNTQWQYDINGNYQTPTYFTPVDETWLNTTYAFNDQGNYQSPAVQMSGRDQLGAITSAENYYNKYFAMCVPLNMPSAGEDYQTGLDTRGTASVIVLRTTGVGGGYTKNAFTWVESEARMDIGAGRQSLIQL